MVDVGVERRAEDYRETGAEPLVCRYNIQCILVWSLETFYTRLLRIITNFTSEPHLLRLTIRTILCILTIIVPVSHLEFLFFIIIIYIINILI